MPPRVVDLAISSRCINKSANAIAHTEALINHNTGINALFQNGIPGVAVMRNPLYIVTSRRIAASNTPNHPASTTALRTFSLPYVSTP